MQTRTVKHWMSLPSPSSRRMKTQQHLPKLLTEGEETGSKGACMQHLLGDWMGHIPANNLVSDANMHQWPTDREGRAASQRYPQEQSYTRLRKPGQHFVKSLTCNPDEEQATRVGHASLWGVMAAEECVKE